MEHCVQRVTQGHRRGVCGEMVEQRSGSSRRVAEQRGVRTDCIPERMQQRDPSVEPGQRVPRTDLKRVRNRLRRHPQESTGIGAKRLVGIGGERAGGEQVQTRNAKSFGSRKFESGARLLPPPGRTGARVKEHARDREIEPDACALNTVNAVEQRCDPIDAARLEVPPAAVKRDLQRRVVAPHLVRDIVGDAGEPRHVEREMREGVALARGEHLVAAPAYRLGAQKRRQRGVRLH